MFRRSPSATGAASAGSERTALSWLTRARVARSKFADEFYFAARDGCTEAQRREAERRAGLPLGVEEPAP